jgi:hypothetical protein
MPFVFLNLKTDLAKHFRLTATAAILAATLVAAPMLLAQDLEPRSYTNVPIGETFLVAGVVRSAGDVAPSGAASPLQDLELTIDALGVGFAHSFDLAGSSAKIDVGASRQCFEGSAIYNGEFVEGDRCGYGDPKIRLTWNFYGAPAMKLAEFSKAETGLVIGTSLQMSVPIGSYENSNLINMGANRWMVRPGLGMSFKSGRWYYDLITSVRLYEDNDDFFNGSKLEQDPLYSVQGHIIYTLNRGSWVSINANFYRGGETSIESVGGDNWKQNSRWGLTYTTPINRHHSIKLYASTGVVTRAGDDFDTYGIGWVYRL